MKTKMFILTILISLMCIPGAFSQTFNQSTDLLLAHYDLKPDEDDMFGFAFRQRDDVGLGESG